MQNSICDKTSWRVEIPDDQLRKVSFDNERTVAYEATSRSYRDFQDVGLFVHPPLPSNEGLSVLWNSWSRFTCNWPHIHCSEERRIVLRETNTGSDATLGGWWPHRSNNSRMELTMEVRQDGDKWSETVTLTIIEVPSGFKIGRINTFTLFIHDDDR